MPGTFSRHRLQREPLVSDPGMHHGTCVTHAPWFMSGSLTRAGGENVPGIPGACATRIFTYLARGPCEIAIYLGWEAKIAIFIGPTWDSPGAERTQVDPNLAPWTLLSGRLNSWLQSTRPLRGLGAFCRIGLLLYRNVRMHTRSLSLRYCKTYIICCSQSSVDINRQVHAGS